MLTDDRFWRQQVTQIERMRQRETQQDIRYIEKDELQTNRETERERKTKRESLFVLLR
jgi:hypothetical protein